MIPLKDMTPRRSVPVMTLLLIAANVAVFVHQLSLTPRQENTFIRTWGLVPSRIGMAFAGHHHALAQALVPLFTCMFLHGGLLHIIGNMWFLWIFGANVEDRLGSLPYLVFYLICGIGSGLSQAFFSWGSHLPSIGASGAISGVLGAYIVLFPGSKILTLIPIIIIPWLVRLPAVIFIGLWFLLQFLSGLSYLQTAGAADTGGTAWWAHIGGFVLGVVFALVAKPKSRRADIWGST
jgi:membrane associated rhomboid family serine protease